MDAICCKNTEENTVKAILPALKKYLQEQKSSKQTIELIKVLLTVSIEFRELLDIFLEETS